MNPRRGEARSVRLPGGSDWRRAGLFSRGRTTEPALWALGPGNWAPSHSSASVSGSMKWAHCGGQWEYLDTQVEAAGFMWPA